MTRFRAALLFTAVWLFAAAISAILGSPRSALPFLLLAAVAGALAVAVSASERRARQ
jgi:F0F1-type ATP synthase assembly protein I